MSSEGASPEELDDLLQEFQRCMANRDWDSATAAVHSIFALSQRWCEDNPTRDFELTQMASKLEDQADWAAAELAYNQILGLPDLEPDAEYKAHAGLVSLCGLLSRDADALDHACRATAAAQRADQHVLWLMALHTQARCLLRCGKLCEARNVIDEAISNLKDDQLYSQMRGSTLILRAECEVLSGNLADAQRDLDAAYSLLKPVVELDCAAGIHSDVSRWWSTTATLRAKLGDHEGSVSAWQKAVASSEHAASMAHARSVYKRVIVADMLKRLGNALLVCGRSTEAAAAFEERQRLLHCLGLPDTASQ